MNENTSGKRVTSIACLVAGVVCLVMALYLDFMAGKDLDIFFLGFKLSGIRGAALVVGALLVLAGLYNYPTETHHRNIINFIFLFPLLFTFAVTVIIPLILGIGYSFTDWDGIRIKEFVGLSNYARAIHQPAFIYSILLTAGFVIVNMILVNVVAFLLALLCSSKLRGVGFFRAAYFLPNLIGGIVLGYIWQFAFSKVLVNFTGALFNYPYSILSDTKLAFMGIIVVYVWQYAGYIMLIYITGLNTVPREVIEAAAIDGANAVDTLFRIKIPMIASTITICSFLTLTNAFKMFDVNLALTGGNGTVTDFMGSRLTNGTEMLALNIYTTAINQNDYSLGQAKAVMFFIILTAVSILQVKVTSSREVEA
ncbi:MAG: sugar ABC transporter permease [Lachnospiraceae bacterium]|nr:sugar ABC transporter permease [Lachnospiraceae bacterium]